MFSVFRVAEIILNLFKRLIDMHRKGHEVHWHLFLDMFMEIIILTSSNNICSPFNLINKKYLEILSQEFWH